MSYVPTSHDTDTSLMTRRWLTSSEAATALGVTKNHIGWLGAQGHLVTRLEGLHRMVDADSLQRLVEDRAQWITLVEAGEMIGCSSKTAQRLARQGHIRQRVTDGTRLPSINRQSVVDYVASVRLGLSR